MAFLRAPFLLYGLIFLVPHVRIKAWSNIAAKTRPGSCLHAIQPSSSQQQLVQKVVVPFFGNVFRLGGDNKGGDRSFVDRMGVPTFASISNNVDFDNDTTITTRPVQGVQPALMIDHVLSSNTCQQIIKACESLGFRDYHVGKNNHGALQIVVDAAVTQTLARRIQPHIHVAAVQALASETARALGQEMDCKDAAKLQFAGLNRRWRIYRYAPGGVQSFAPHIDAAFPPSGLTADGTDILWDISDGTIVSRLTLLLYLNDNFQGGETVFYHTSLPPLKVLQAVQPVTGSVLVFPQAVGEAAVDYARRHWPLHEGSPVRTGAPKYVIRSDVLFTTDA